MEIGNAEEICAGTVLLHAITCYWMEALLAVLLERYCTSVAMGEREKRYVTSGWC